MKAIVNTFPFIFQVNIRFMALECWQFSPATVLCKSPKVRSLLGPHDWNLSCLPKNNNFINHFLFGFIKPKTKELKFTMQLSFLLNS